MTSSFLLAHRSYAALFAAGSASPPPFVPEPGSDSIAAAQRTGKLDGAFGYPCFGKGFSLGFGK
jgi:hypothetical protein